MIIISDTLDWFQFFTLVNWEDVQLSNPVVDFWEISDVNWEIKNKLLNKKEFSKDLVLKLRHPIISYELFVKEWEGLITNRPVKLFSTITHSENFNPKDFFMSEIWSKELNNEVLKNTPFAEINESMTYIDQHRLLLDTAHTIKTRNWANFQDTEMLRKMNQGMTYSDIHSLDGENKNLQQAAKEWETKKSKLNRELRKEKIKSPDAVKLEIFFDHLQKKESIEKYQNSLDHKDEEIKKILKESLIKSGDYYNKNINSLKKATCVIKPISKFML